MATRHADGVEGGRAAAKCLRGEAKPPAAGNAALRAAVVGRKNYYGSGSAWAAAAAGRIWTVTASAARAGCNPLSYLVAYLEACAREGGRAPAGEALARFFPWALAAADAAAWREAPLEPPSGPAP